jgi:hypothetical protein
VVLLVNLLLFAGLVIVGLRAHSLGVLAAGVTTSPTPRPLLSGVLREGVWDGGRRSW